TTAPSPLSLPDALPISRCGERHRIRPAPGHGAATREVRRADGLHAVREGSCPAPGDCGAHGDRIHGRIGAAVVAAHELDAGAGRSEEHTSELQSPYDLV